MLIQNVIKDLSVPYTVHLYIFCIYYNIFAYKIVSTELVELLAYDAMQNSLPSAPKSGLKDFFSLKFLKIFTRLLLSRIAYLDLKQKVMSVFMFLTVDEYIR